MISLDNLLHDAYVIFPKRWRKFWDKAPYMPIFGYKGVVSIKIKFILMCNKTMIFKKPVDQENFKRSAVN